MIKLKPDASVPAGPLCGVLRDVEGITNILSALSERELAADRLIYAYLSNCLFNVQEDLEALLGDEEEDPEPPCKIVPLGPKPEAAQ